MRPIVRNTPAYITGLNIAVASNTTLTVSAGSCSDSANAFDLVLANSVTINSAVNGVNGLDTGTIASAGVYAVYVIGQDTGFSNPACLISLSATTPLLPAGYDIYRRIGWAATSGSNFIKMIQTGSDMNRTYWLDTIVSVLSGGTSATLAAVDLSAIVPAINTKVYLNASFTPNAAADSAYLTSGSSVATTILQLTGVVAAKAQSAQLITLATLVLGVPTVQYKVTASGSLNLLVTAFEDYL